MNGWMKFALRLFARHPSEAASVLGAAAVVGKAIAEDSTLAGYLAEATGIPVDQVPRLLADLAGIHK